MILEMTIIGNLIILFSMLATGAITVFVSIGGDWNNLFYEERPRVESGIKPLWREGGVGDGI